MNSICLLSLKIEFDQFARSTSLNSISLLSLKIEFDQFARLTSLNLISLLGRQVTIRSVELTEQLGQFLTRQKWIIETIDATLSKNVT